MLNALRREALAALECARMSVSRENLPWARDAVQFLAADKPLLMAQSGDTAVLARALACGADMAVFAPEDVQPGALEGVDLSPLAGRVALAVPAVLTAEALDGLNAWAKARPFEITFLSNVGQLGLEWPGEKTGDNMLNIGNDLSVAQLRDWGLGAYTPSVELNAGQINALGGRRNLIVWGRIPLMYLRHCPLRSARGMKGPHDGCRHCDACPPPDRLNGRAMTDRKGAAFPLRRLAMPGGCAVQMLNSAALMPLRRLDRLPGGCDWRLLLGADEPVEAVMKVYRAALDGGDFRSLPEWSAIEGMNTTTGHYFRGVL